MSLYDPFNLLKTKKESIGKPPGSLAYSGGFSDVDIAIDVVNYNNESIFFSPVVKHEALTDIFKLSSKSENVFWINIVGLHNQEIIKSVGKFFDIHTMDLEDIVHVSQLSKVINQGDYLFSTIKMIYMNKDVIKHEHVSILLKNNVVFTFQETPGDVFDNLRKLLDNPDSFLRIRDSGYLFYSMLDSIIDEYIVVINSISVRFNEIEVQVIDKKKSVKDNLYGLRKELLYFSNSLIPLIDSFKNFTAAGNPYLPSDILPYYSDLSDHLNQIYSSLKAYREMIDSLYDMHISDVSMKMNRTMMTLTVFSAIFIPLSFLAGVFGMNFKSLPGLDNSWSFVAFVIFCVALACGMLIYFKIKKWF